MGIYDRDYYRNDPPTGSPRRGFTSWLPRTSMWSMNTWLIIVNIAVFVIDQLLAKYVGVYAASIDHQLVAMKPIEFWGYFSETMAFSHLQLWRLITFQFLHANVMHIFGNMLGLYFFGSYVEQYLGSARYLAFYLLCGAAGPISYLALWGAGFLVTSAGVPLIGASAGVYGVVIALAVLAPNATAMLLIFPFPMKLSTLAWAYVGIAAFIVLTNGANAGGQAAHLGGALVGFVLIRRAGWLNIFVPSQWGKRRAKRQKHQWFDPSQATSSTAGGGEPWGDASGSGRSGTDKMSQEVDRILEKVQRHGLASLSEREKRTLREATERQRGH